MLRRETGPGYDILRLEHGKASALDLELCVALESAFAELAASPPPALLITGRDAIFCAGVDLLRLKTGGEGYVAEFLPALTRAIEAMVQLPMSVVAAVIEASPSRSKKPRRLRGFDLRPHTISSARCGSSE